MTSASSLCTSGFTLKRGEFRLSITPSKLKSCESVTGCSLIWLAGT